MKKHAAPIFVVLIAIIGMARHTHAASFDCRQAATSVERLICTDSGISALDEKLHETYATALSAVASFNKPDLIKEQRDWVRYTRDICQDTDCLKQAYAERIVVLARNAKYIVNKSSCEIPSGNTSCVNVVFYRDPSIRITSFNQSLTDQKKSGAIIGCSKLINLPTGSAGSNNSYGGFCTLQDGNQRRPVEICNDDMIGHFAIKPVEPQGISDNTLIDFVNDHCFGS